MRGVSASNGLALAISLPTIAVLLVVFSSLLTPNVDTLAHLWRHVLPDVLRNTLLLVTLVAFFTALLGSGFAWLVAACDFPGRRFFRWALVLPLALPGYVLAFVFLGLFDYAGPVHSAARTLTGLDLRGDWIRGLPGLVLVMSLALYPYVYLLARGAFETLGTQAMEAARTLGMGPRRAFLHVALPMARPWILAGTLLVVMETLADFGTVAVFNYDTFTTAIYKSWFSMFSLDGALNLSSVLLLVVFAVVAFERRFAAGARYQVGDSQARRRIRLSPAAGLLACGAATLLLTFALFVPLVQLIVWAFGPALGEWNTRYLVFAGRSLFLSGVAAIGICVLALALAYAQRGGGRIARLAGRVATMGYALPGTVLAVGVFVPLMALGAGLGTLLNTLGVAGAGNVLQGTLAVLLVAYAIRFMAVAFSPIENGMLRITKHYDEAARLHGVHGVELARRVHLPMLRPGLVAAMLLVFVDVMKEMPITLMTRPFGWETLAVRVFEKTAEGHWQQAAPAALAIVLVGLLPVALLSKGGGHAIAR